MPSYLNLNTLKPANNLGSAFTPAPAPKLQGPGFGYAGSSDYFTPTTSNVLGASTNTPFNGFNTVTNNANNAFNTGMTNIQNNQNAGFDIIEADYNNALSTLSNQESSLRNQAGSTSNQIDSEAAASSAQLNDAQAQAESGVNSYLQTGEKTAKSQIQQARDLYRETQQGNISQLSALGISSSSVTEALAEKLGVETAKRIGSVSSTLGELQVNAGKELANLKEHYTNKRTELQTWVNNQKAAIQNTLLDGLNQLNSVRNQAANDKARARQTLIINSQNNLAQLQGTYDQFQMQLAQWAQQKSSVLTPLSQGDFQAVMGNQIAKLQEQFSPTQFNVTPEISLDAFGRQTGRISVDPKKPQPGDTRQVGGATYVFDGVSWTKEDF